MGRVIKGSAQSAERYTLAIPALTIAPPPRADDGSFQLDPEPAHVEFVPAPPPEPTIDLDAIKAQAQEVVDAADASAESIIAAAHDRAAIVLADAATQARLLADDARRTAHDDGYASGVSDANVAMAEMIDTLRDILEATRKERHALLTSAEPELVRLAVGIAERVLHQQIALDHGVVVEMARAAISRIVDREKITVRVNPGDIERMREHRDELLALGDVKNMRVIEDQRVDRGGVILETDAGSIDAKISTQLSEVRKILHIVDDVVVQPIPVQTEEPDEPALNASRAS